MLRFRIAIRHYTHTGDLAARQSVDALPCVIDAPNTVATEIIPVAKGKGKKRPPVPAWARDLLGKMTPDNWQAIREQLLV